MNETPIELVEYDPDWPDRFEDERDRLEHVVGPHVERIEHVGSTAVPGLAAKPIVDVLAVVDDPTGLLGDLDELATWYGYELSHVPRDWLFVQRTDDDGEAYNLHLVPESNDRWRDDLLFREYLRANAEARDTYENAKRDAADAHPEDLDGYNRAKADVIATLRERARADDATTVPPPTDR